MKDVKFAFDKASVRTYDEDGMMHVALTPISKANVCIYYGKEIPDSEALGLDPNKAYRLLRDPEELKKAVSTFNNKPVLNKHIGVTVIDPPKDAIVGSTGERAEFDGTYLKNSMVIWDLDSILGVETEKQKEISSSYRYRLDLTAGEYEGETYDGVMRDIVCNHVAIVPSGRAGPDVFVYDSKPIGIKLMSKLEKLWAYLLPKLASDADPDEVKKEVGNVIKDEDDDKDDKKNKTADDEDSDKKEKAADDSDDEDDKSKKTADDESDDKKAKDNKMAMDAAISAVERKFMELRQAERDVRPVVGELACDSAEDVYRTALKQMGCEDYASIPASGLRSVFNAYSKVPTMAQDSAPIAASSRDNVRKFFDGDK